MLAGRAIEGTVTCHGHYQFRVVSLLDVNRRQLSKGSGRKQYSGNTCDFGANPDAWQSQ
jgi:hypothetical protein